MALTVLTIGHSTLPYAGFLALARGAGVTAIADVRSVPYSRFQGHFDRETLKASLAQDGIGYVFLGEELGGRPNDPALFRDRRADYDAMAATDAVTHGLRRVVEGAARHRIALMCSEQDPIDCHRCLLLGRALSRQGVHVGHILADGAQAGQAQIEDDLLARSGRASEDLFATREERLAAAYHDRARKVAYAVEAGMAAAAD